MNTSSLITNAYLLLLLLCTGCYRPERPHLIIKNNSGEIIRVFLQRHPLETPLESCFTPTSEYDDMISDDCKILPCSEKDFVKDGLLSWYTSIIQNDIIYIYVYLVDDIMNMSCEEFKSINPVKHVWVVSRDDMDACDWTLTYPPSERIQ